MTQIAVTIIRAPGCSTLMRTFDSISGNTIGATSWTDGYICGPMIQPTHALLKCRSEGVLFWRKECEEIDSRIDPDSRDDWFRQHDFEFAAEPTKGDLMHALRAGMGATRAKELYLRTTLWHRYNDRYRFLGWAIPEKLSGERAENWKLRVHRAFEANGCDTEWFVSRIASRDGLDMKQPPKRSREAPPLPSIGRLNDFFHRAFRGDNLDVVLAKRFESAFLRVVKRHFWNAKVTDNMKAMLPLLNGDENDALLSRAEIMRELGDFDEAKSTLARRRHRDTEWVPVFLERLIDQATRLVEPLPNIT